MTVKKTLEPINKVLEEEKVKRVIDLKWPNGGEAWVPKVWGNWFGFKPRRGDRIIAK